MDDVIRIGPDDPVTTSRRAGMAAGMKVLIITTLYHPHYQGGAEVSIKTMVEALRAAGCEVSVLATNGDKGLTSDMVNGVRVWRAGLRNVYWHHSKEPKGFVRRRIWHLFDIFNPLMVGYADCVFNAVKPDIVQIHATIGWTSALLRWASKLDVPVVQVLHAYELLCPKASTYQNDKSCVHQCLTCRIMRQPHRRYSRSLAAVVGVSNAMLKRHRDFGFFSSVGHIQTIYNAREPSVLGLTGAPKNENAIDLPNPITGAYPDPKIVDADKVRFGFMGTITKMKGIELLLTTFTGLSISNSVLWVAGVGDSEYVTSLRRLYGGDNVRFVGKSYPAQFFRDIDVAVVPSIWNEPLAGVNFEALAFGCPVIASSRGGNEEIVVNGVNGIVFDPDRPAELGSAMEKLAKDDALRKKLSQAAPSSVVKFLSPSRIASDYMDLYQRLISRGSHG